MDESNRLDLQYVSSPEYVRLLGLALSEGLLPELLLKASQGKAEPLRKTLHMLSLALDLNGQQ